MCPLQIKWNKIVYVVYSLISQTSSSPFLLSERNVDILKRTRETCVHLAFSFSSTSLINLNPHTAITKSAVSSSAKCVNTERWIHLVEAAEKARQTRKLDKMGWQMCFRSLLGRASKYCRGSSQNSPNAINLVQKSTGLAAATAAGPRTSYCSSAPANVNKKKRGYLSVLTADCKCFCFWVVFFFFVVRPNTGL